MGRRGPIDGERVSLWIECAHRCLAKAGEDECADVVRTFQTERQFCVVLVSGTQGGEQARERADTMAARLAQGDPLADVAAGALAALSSRAHVPFSILQVLDGTQVYVIECDAPPLFLVHESYLLLLPVLEEERHGRLVRQSQFELHDGDHLAMVSEGYLYPRRWGWRGIAHAVRRWTDTNCDAGELLDALVSTYRRLNKQALDRDVTVVAMHARPIRSATLWTGPPVDGEQDEKVLHAVMAEEGRRVICGGTTASIAARLLEAELAVEPRPADGWAEVPPVSQLEGIDLVTEGLVTLRKAQERMIGVERARDLTAGEDGATRLARTLLASDKIHVIVGLAVNPQQVDDSGVPLRRSIVEDLIADLRARGKLVTVETC